MGVGGVTFQNSQSDQHTHFTQQMAMCAEVSESVKGLNLNSLKLFILNS